MVDVLTPEQRRRNMSHIRGKNTKPEMFLRQGLHRRGLRFRLHRRDLPGRPDIVFPSRKVVLFVHGCFWHWHGCSLSKLPSTRQEFWREKLVGNVKRDRKVIEQLIQCGWHVLIVWECAIKGRRRLSSVELLDRCEAFIRSPEDILEFEISGA